MPKKWDQELKEVAIARLTLGDTPTSIAKDLGIPGGTVRDWKHKLTKIKQQDGSLGYHFDERKKFTKRAWKIVHKILGRIEEKAEKVEITSAQDLKQLATVVGILYDKVVRGSAEEGFGKGKKRPDFSGVTTENLRLIVAEIQRTTQVPLLEPKDMHPLGEVVEGKSREISK